jgi:hypothetical protein
VIWRKISFGNHSATGRRFAQRILTAVQTPRLQNRPVLAYLRDAVTVTKSQPHSPNCGKPATACIPGRQPLGAAPRVAQRSG